MKTESIIPNQVESLEDAANNHADEVYENANDFDQIIGWGNRKHNFIQGALWQQKQIQPLVGSHAELLAVLQECASELSLFAEDDSLLLDPKDKNSNPRTWAYRKALSAIEKAKQIKL